MYENRIQHLEESHRALDQQIDGLERTGRFDDLHLQNLKKQRLQLRDEIAKLMKLQWQHDREYLEADDE